MVCESWYDCNMFSFESSLSVLLTVTALNTILKLEIGGTVVPQVTCMFSHSPANRIGIHTKKMTITVKVNVELHKCITAQITVFFRKNSLERKWKLIG